MSGAERGRPAITSTATPFDQGFDGSERLRMISTRRVDGQGHTLTCAATFGGMPLDNATRRFDNHGHEPAGRGYSGYRVRRRR